MKLGTLVARFPERADSLVPVASLVTHAKRVAVFGTWGLTAALSVAVAVAAVRGQCAARSDSP
jgi:ADP-ribosylglycohydrolase